MTADNLSELMKGNFASMVMCVDGRWYDICGIEPVKPGLVDYYAAAKFVLKPIEESEQAKEKS